MGEWLNIRSRTSASSVAATGPSLDAAGLQKPETRGIALIQNYLDTARMDTRGAFAAFRTATQFAESYLHLVHLLPR